MYKRLQLLKIVRFAAASDYGFEPCGVGEGQTGKLTLGGVIRE